MLAFTAAKMIVGEPLLDPIFDESSWNALARGLTYTVAIVGVLGLGTWTARRAAQQSQSGSTV